MSIPLVFNSHGVLEPGTYPATFLEIRSSILVAGNSFSPNWDFGWRNQLVDNLEIMASQLYSGGVNQIFIDGSFVEDKDRPNDIDGYFDPGFNMYDKDDIQRFSDLISHLNSLDPHKVWTWDPRSRKPYRGYGKHQLPMWHFYRVELYPHLRQPSGIKDAQGNDLVFPSAFRQSRRDFVPKGIVQLIK